MDQLQFEIDVVQLDSIYGVRVFVDGMSDSDEVPCYYLVLSQLDSGGKTDPFEIANAFGVAHQDAMAGLDPDGQLELEVFIEDSIELAAELMVRHGFDFVKLDEVPPDIYGYLFARAYENEPFSVN